MRIEELKKGFWGFQKDGVFRFIAQQEEGFAQKLAEKDAQMERRSQQDQERIQRLEEENRKLQAELERFQKQQDLIAQAILDARASADALKAESQAQEAAARETVRLTLDREMREMERYRENIAALREALHAMTKELDRKADQAEEQVKEVYAAAPMHNLTLFQ